jgi:hypothetical protein
MVLLPEIYRFITVTCVIKQTYGLFSLLLLLLTNVAIARW